MGGRKNRGVGKISGERKTSETGDNWVPGGRDQRTTSFGEQKKKGTTKKQLLQSSTGSERGQNKRKEKARLSASKHQRKVGPTLREKIGRRPCLKE